MVDLDQGGSFQQTRVYLGPSLGWVLTQIKPSVTLTVGGAYTAPAGTSLILVNVSSAVTVNLPSVAAWVREFAYQPATAFDRGIWVKDLGGHFASFNCSVQPFGGDTIDRAVSTLTLNQNFTCLRLYPLIDLSGWYVG